MIILTMHPYTFNTFCVIDFDSPLKLSQRDTKCRYNAQEVKKKKETEKKNLATVLGVNCIKKLGRYNIRFICFFANFIFQMFTF